MSKKSTNSFFNPDMPVLEFFLNASGISTNDNRRTVSVCPSLRLSVGQERGVVRIFCWAGSALRVLNQLFDIWLFFNSLFLCPCKFFFVLFFRRFFPLVSVPGETFGHILPLFTHLWYSPWMGCWVWAHLYNIWIIFIIYTIQYM